MSEISLREHEQDVEEARAKLVGSLATLRSPETMSSFTDGLKKDALDTKDALVDKAKASAQSAVAGVIEDWKAKAAANPAATLAIGAGLAWRVIHRPPIASALVGLGIYSLWRTNASRPPGSYRPDYLAEGKHRLKEQAAEALAVAKDVAGQGRAVLSAKAAELSQGAKAKAAELTEDARDKAAELTEGVKDKARQWSQDIRDAAGEMAPSPAGEHIDAPSVSPVREIAESVSAKADELFNTTVSATQNAWADRDSRDKVLLGVASLAVAAALGIACQKRLTEHE